MSITLLTKVWPCAVTETDKVGSGSVKVAEEAVNDARASAEKKDKKGAIIASSMSDGDEEGEFIGKTGFATIC